MKKQTKKKPTNPIPHLPPETVAEGLKAIRNYFAELDETGVDYLYEAKLLIVGEAGAGKTTLARKLKAPLCDLPKDKDTTRGIDVTQWQFTRADGRNFRVNIWDFGGQEIYKNTHRFFLTKRSLYVLLSDERREDTYFDYWLHIVDTLADGSPLLPVLNERAGRLRPNPIPARLRGKFENVINPEELDLADPAKIERLQATLQYQLGRLSHIGTELPASWVRVRQALEALPDDWITLDKYRTTCAEHGISKPERQDYLSRYLHDLGVVLHFQDDDLLRKMVILKPEWATNAAYKVIDSPLVSRERKGRFGRNDLKHIWTEARYAEMRAELLELMLKFKLCYRVPNASTESFVAPELLPETPPDYAWEDRNNLVMHYRYPGFMPKGIITQLIVALHDLIVEQRLVWSSGVVVEFDQAQSQIKEDFGERKIEIRVAGQNKKVLLGIIRKELEVIHQQFHRPSLAQQWIPCHCETCQKAKSPELFDYDKLRKLLNKNVKTYHCPESGEALEIQRLIDDVIDQQGLFSPDAKEMRRALQAALVERFSPEELRALSFELGEDFDNLPRTEQGKGSSARELVLLFERKAELPRLRDAAVRQRRDLRSWSFRGGEE